MTLRRRLLDVSALGLAVRVVALDARVAHFDEGRVAFWALQYARTGEWTYSPYLHGPLLFHVERVLFRTLGPSDAVMRLPVALVGGLLPLSASLYRDHLSDREVVALGLLLAANPLFLYYSRFLRNDLLVAAAALVTLGCVLRLRATRRPRYLYAASVALALAFATKENALLYVLAWVGAGGLLALRGRGADLFAGRRRLAEVGTAARRLRSRWTVHAALACAAFVALFVVSYAPRGGTGPRIGLLLDPDHTLAVVHAATVDAGGRFVGTWVAEGVHAGGRYPVYLPLLAALAALGGAGVVGCAWLGFRAAQVGDGTRPLLAFAAYWAGATLVGYPLAVDVVGGWTAVHLLVPLCLPAAVSLAALVASARAHRHAVLALALLGAYLVGASLVTSYLAPAALYNPYGQPAQPENALGGTLDTVRTVAAAHDGTDLGYYGSYYRNHLYRFPLPWYTARWNVTTGTASLDTPPPVVVTREPAAGRVAERLDGYGCVAHYLTPWVDRGPGTRFTRVVVFVDARYLERPGSRWVGPPCEDRASYTVGQKSVSTCGVPVGPQVLTIFCPIVLFAPVRYPSQ